MYEVIHFFTDLQDGNHAYRVGDEFPRHGVSVTDARIKELSGSYNKQCTPLIKLVEREKEKAVETVEVAETSTEKVYTKTEINRLSKDELVALATDNGVEGAADMSGADLKVKLIEMLVK